MKIENGGIIGTNRFNVYLIEKGFKIECQSNWRLCDYCILIMC